MADSSVAALLGVAFTAAGFAFGLYQYRINSEQSNLARRRERAVVATHETREFFSDPNVRFVMELLDYGQAAFVDGDLKGKLFQRSQLKSALKVHWIGQKGSEVIWEDAALREYRAIRASFDAFLNWLERIEVLISNDVIGVAGFGDLFSYWLMLLSEIPGANDTLVHVGDTEREAIWDYIRGYEFNLVVRLFARYHRAGKVDVRGFKPRPANIDACP